MTATRDYVSYWYWPGRWPGRGVGQFHTTNLYEDDASAQYIGL